MIAPMTATVQTAHAKDLKGQGRCNWVGDTGSSALSNHICKPMMCPRSERLAHNQGPAGVKGGVVVVVVVAVVVVVVVVV